MLVVPLKSWRSAAHRQTISEVKIIAPRTNGYLFITLSLTWNITSYSRPDGAIRTRFHHQGGAVGAAEAFCVDHFQDEHVATSDQVSELQHRPVVRAVEHHLVSRSAVTSYYPWWADTVRAVEHHLVSRPGVTAPGKQTRSYYPWWADWKLNPVF